MIREDRFWRKQVLIYLLAVLLILAISMPAAYRSFRSRINPAPDDPDNAAIIDMRSVDVNTAGVEELSGLPGIGPSLAGRLVEERARGGIFRSISDLERVKGIGPAKAALIEPYIYFETGAAESSGQAVQ